MKLRKIEYIKKENINLKGLASIDETAKKNIENTKNGVGMIIRILIDDDNKVHIEYADIISIDTIREAATLEEDIDEVDIKQTPTKEELEEWFQINMTLIGTKGALKQESQFEVYNKKKLLERLKELLPDEEFGYSITMGLKEGHKGI